MPLEDRFGLALSTTNDAPVADYIAAVDLMLSANAGAETLYDRALATDPDFALALIAKARLLQVQARVTEAKAAAARARALADRVTPREARHIEIVARAIDGDGPGAMTLLREHMDEYPRDGVPLSLALGVFGLFGFSGRLDHHEAQLALLETLAPHWRDDWWFLTYLGWARIELGDVARGAVEVERALDGNPRNAFAAHARAHGYYEAGDAERGAAFIESWLPGYSRAGQLHGHISWHLALFELARDNADRAREVYFDSVRPSVSAAPPLFALADAASFLWRWQIYDAGVTLGDGPEVAAHARMNFPQAGVHFADVHAALAEDAALTAERVAQSRERVAGGRQPQGPVVPELCAGVAAFATGDYAAAKERLAAAMAELPRIGGSHAQREVFEDTYIVACLRAGAPHEAAARLKMRLARRPSARDERWLALTGLKGNLSRKRAVRPGQRNFRSLGYGQRTHRRRRQEGDRRHQGSRREDDRQQAAGKRGQGRQGRGPRALGGRARQGRGARTCRRQALKRGPDTPTTIRNSGATMRLLILILLILLLVGALPTWPYSTGWGYYPSGGLGLLVLILVVVLIFG